MKKYAEDVFYVNVEKDEWMDLGEYIRKIVREELDEIERLKALEE